MIKTKYIFRFFGHRYYVDLMFYIRFHRILWHIRRCHQAPIKEFNQHPLLSRNSCHPTTYILKLSICYHNFIP